VIDVGEDEAGPFLVMELVEGVSLFHLVDAVTVKTDILGAVGGSAG
jgi:hypothetical protein